MLKHTFVEIEVTRNDGGPCPFRLDEDLCFVQNLWPCVSSVDQIDDGRGKCLRVAGTEEKARLTICDQFAMAADIRRYDESSLRHGFKRL